MWKSSNFKVVKKILLLSLTGIFAFFLFPHPAAGQSASTLSLRTQVWLQSVEDHSANAPILIKGNPEDIEIAVPMHYGVVKYCRGDICAATVPISQIESLSNSNGISRIEGPGINGMPLMDTALIVNRIEGVHQGIGLPEDYTGEGVIIGIIDDGIYFNHGDFMRDDSSTRIRYIWDQNRAAGVNSPLPYNYGREWSWLDIDAGNCDHVEQGNGHGTNVTGIAASDGSSLSEYKGVAPDAEIIAVSIDYGSSFLSNVVDAVDYIFKKADALGKPCVINTSLGTYIGSHDGKDLTSQLIENLLDERGGRSLVAAAGNAREFDFHLGYSAGPDTNFTWFTYNNSLNAIGYEFWIDSTDMLNFNFCIGVNSDTNYQELGKISWIDIDIVEGLVQSSTAYNELLRSGATVFGSVKIRAERVEGTYHVVVITDLTPGIPAYEDYLYSLKVTGSGRFDLWSSSVLTGSSNFYTGTLPPTSLYPPIINYKSEDNLMSMVSSWQNSTHVMAVANFSNRAWYIDADSNQFQTGEIPGAIFRTSSIGPSRDGRIKPNVSATGSTTLSTGNLDHIDRLINVGPNESFKVAYGELHNRNGGTSMASPIVAGIVALYFQRNPNATWSEVMQVIEATTYQDGFTGSNLPNPGWGYGKVNGLAALQFPVMLGCTDPTAFNYDSTANIDDGSCEPFIYGCLDSNALNYNPAANSPDSCIYDDTTGIKSLEDIGLSLYPNPAERQIRIEIEGDGSPIEIAVFSLDGKEVMSSFDLVQSQWIDISNLNPGLYLFRIKSNQLTFSERIIIY